MPETQPTMEEAASGLGRTLEFLGGKVREYEAAVARRSRVEACLEQLAAKRKKTKVQLLQSCRLVFSGQRTREAEKMNQAQKQDHDAKEEGSGDPGYEGGDESVEKKRQAGRGRAESSGSDSQNLYEIFEARHEETAKVGWDEVRRRGWSEGFRSRTRVGQSEMPGWRKRDWTALFTC